MLIEGSWCKREYVDKNICELLLNLWTKIYNLKNSLDNPFTQKSYIQIVDSRCCCHNLSNVPECFSIYMYFSEGSP